MGKTVKKILLCLSILFFLSSTTSVFAETVVFTVKYHKPVCQWAKKCTLNCTNVDKKEAIKHDGKPCKVCGG